MTKHERQESDEERIADLELQGEDAADVAGGTGTTGGSAVRTASPRTSR